MLPKKPFFIKKIAPILGIMLCDVASVRAAFPVLTLLFFDLSSSLFSPSITHETRSYWYGICVAMPALLGIVSGLLLSCLSDVWGRKRILLLAIIGTAIAATLCGFAVIMGSLRLFLVGCIIQGIFSKTNPVAQAVIADSTEGALKVTAMGYLQTAMSIGAFISPIIGGQVAIIFFHQMNYAAPFFASLIFAILALVIAFVFFKESFSVAEKSAKKSIMLKSLWSVFTLRQVLWISAILFFSQISWSMYYQYIGPSLHAIFHSPASTLGLFIGLIALWLAVASSVGIRYTAARYSLNQLLMIGCVLELAGNILSIIGLLQHSQSTLWLAAIPIAAGDVIAYSAISTLYSNAVSNQQQGSVMGVCFFVIGVTWSVTGLTGGYLFSLSPLAPLMVSPIFVLIALLLTYKLIRKRRFSVRTLPH